MNYIEYLNPPIISLIIGLFLTIIIYYAGPIIISRIAEYINIDKDKIMTYFQIPLVVTTGLLTIGYSIEISMYTHVFNPWYESTITTLIILVWVGGIIKIGNIFLHKTLKKEKESHDVIPIVENVWVFIAIVCTIFLILNVWSIDVTPILASAGVAGVIVGFAARDTIENFFGGIALYADQTYYPGDFIELDSETRGWVREISIRSTVLHTLDGDSVTIPNSKLHKSIIRNKSTPKNAFRISLDVGVSYDSDPQKVQKVLEETISDIVNEEDSIILKNPRPQVHLRNFGDSSIDYEIFVWIELPNQKPKIQTIVNKKLYDSLEKENIRIPYPQRTVHFE